MSDIPSLKLTYLLKMDGWKTIRFLLKRPRLQVRTVSLREGNHSAPNCPVIVFFPAETAIASPRAPTANRPRMVGRHGAVFGHQKCTKTVVGSQKMYTYVYY